MARRRIEHCSTVGVPRDRVFAFFNNPENLGRITPPGIRVEIVSGPEHPRVGDTMLLKVGRGPIVLSWEARFIEFEPGVRFVDEQGKGPFKSFRHQHVFEDAGDGRTRLIDIIDYEPPFGLLGVLADWLFLSRDLKQMLDYRHKRTREILESKEPIA